MSVGLRLPGQWVRLAVPGDGNCAFYALASSLNLCGYRDLDLESQVRVGRELRRRLLTGREDQWEQFVAERGFKGLAPSLHAYMAHSVYADDFLMNFVAWLLRLHIVVLAGSQIVEFGSGDVCVVLAWFRESQHFESVVARAKERSGDERDVIRKAVLRIARRGVRRSPGNAERMASESIRQCKRGYEGLFHKRDVAFS